MASSVIEAKNPSNLKPLFGENYEQTLNESIQNLLAEAHNSNKKSEFIDKFFELTQAKLDPPLESIWVYAALKFQSQNSANEDTKTRISAFNNLFQLISACSASCTSLKSVALIAPVVFEVYNVAVESCGKELSSKKERKLMREIKSLVDCIVGYISLCYCKGVSEENEVDLVMDVEDLVRVWVGSSGGVRRFFPLVSDEVCQMISMVGWDLNYLAGAVIAEAFLLRLCLSFRSGVARGELEKELKSWVVGSITAFRSSYFYEILVRMLLETSLPVTSLVGSEDEALLRKTLLDAIILVDYSFLKPNFAINMPPKNMKSLALARLIVIHAAIDTFWKKGDQTKAISYSKAFCTSDFPSELVRWITSQIGLEEKAGEAYKSSPKSLIKWLLQLEAQGYRVFDDAFSKLRAKLILDNSEAGCKYPVSKTNTGADDTFYIDNKGEEDDEEDKMTNDSAVAAFVAAAQTIRSTETEGRKRKDKESAETEKQIKFLKHELIDNSGSPRERTSLVSDDDINTDSEVENPSSDDDM